MQNHVSGLVAILALLFCSTASGEQIAEIDWTELLGQSPEPAAHLSESAPDWSTASLLVEAQDEPVSISQLLVQYAPTTSTGRYTMHLRIRHEIEGPEPATLQFALLGGNGGVLNVSEATVSGQSDWRDCSIVFDWTPQMGALEHLGLFITVPPDSRIWIGPPSIYRSPPNGSLRWLWLIHAWWSRSQGIAVAVALLLCFAALTLAVVWFSRRPQSSLLMKLTLWFLAASSSFCLVVGTWAVTLRQPGQVCIPLFVAGGFGCTAVAAVWRTVRRRFSPGVPMNSQTTVHSADDNAES